MTQTQTSLFKRIISAILTLVLVLGILPMAAPHAHAAEPVTLTNKDGEVTNKFTIGEPIYVETTGYTSTEWLSLWYLKPDGSYESNYRLWWYASDEKMLLWDAVWTKNFAWDGMNMPAGTYYIYYAETDELASFTLVEPDATVVAEKSLAVAVDGKKVSIDAINYSEYSQVSITNASGVEMYQYFCPGRNGLTMEYELIPGEYTISMYNDYYKEELYDQKTITVEGEKVEILTTDKTEYKFGEPIMVTSQLGNPNWLGLYKQDDTNIADGGTTSMFCLYPTVGQAVNILSGEQQRHGEFVAGTYKVLLLNANYGVVASVENIVITTEIDENKTVTVPATCEKEGSITYYNTDGTVAKVDTLEALDHDYETLRPSFDEENLQHTLICNNDNTHTITENCKWDEGVVTEQPTEEKEGTKEFTCTVCGGHKYEAVSAKVIDHEEVTKKPTCEEPGTKVVYYTDGSSKEVEIPKLNHAYPEKFTYDGAEKKTHSKVCANDAAHVVTENCSFESSAISGGIRYTCSVCGGSYDVIIISTNKTEYALGEPILITVNPDVYDETAKDWVGIWERDYNPDYDISIYYYYPASEGWTDFNIKNASVHQIPKYQSSEIGVGTYTLRLFTNDSYDEITNVTITVGPAVRDESKTVRVEPTCEADGSITYYLTDGTVEKVITAAEDETLKRLGHAYPDTWTPVAGTETHSRVCGNDAEHVETKDCSWDAGVETVPPTAGSKGEMKYSCTVCGNTKTEEIPELTATEVSRTVVEPTCDDKGYTLVTYDNGDTRKIDYVDALGHDFGGDYTHIDGTHTHSQKCQRKDCDEVEITNCQLETNGVLDGNGYYYNCTKCGDWTENVILTDKAVYATGEDIIVTVHPNYAPKLGGTDWIGLYKKGESPNADKNPTSIRWNYAGDFVGGMNIFNTSNHDRPEEDPDNFLKAGEYVLFLCANDGFSVLARTTITVTAEIDPTKTVRVDPTCTEDGTITYYNTDGTVAKVITAAEDENLKAKGHTYGDWRYDGVEKQTHTHTCFCTHSESADCSWNQGEVTKEATTEETGVKTYTCTVCPGTREEILPKVNVTVTGTETVEATCDDPGYTRTFYSDGTYSDEVIPAKGHAYGEWTYDAETKHHKKTCANDATHVISEACTMEKLVVDTSVNYTCTVCEGGYVTGLLETDKAVYEVFDPIMVTVHATYSGAWVGLYKEGELFDPDNGGVAALYWSYISQGMVGKPFDITAVTNSTNSGTRGERLGNGKYVLVFFGDSGYGDVINRVEIELFTDMSNTEFDLLFYKAEVRPNGYHRRFQLKEVDNPAADEKVSLGVNVTAGEIGSSWVGVFEGDYNLETDFNGMTPIVEKYIADINGKTPFTLNRASEGGFDFYVGNFTIVIFADASTNYPVKYVTFEVYRPIVSEEIYREPTCDTPGTKYVVYEDDNNDNTEDEGLVIIPALGHQFGEWARVEGTNTHSRTCSRDICGDVETEACTFENGTCVVCNSAEQHIHDLTKVEKKTADCTNAGNIEYYTCECGAWFKDAAATQEITDKDSVVLPTFGHSWNPATCTTPKTCANCQTAEGVALGHAYGEWVFDENTKTHTHTCAHEASHTESETCSFGAAEVIKQAVGNNKGIKKYTCTICSGSYTEEYAAEATDTSERIYGEDRYQTAITVAERLKENLGLEKFQTIVVASGNEFADALSGTYLANQKNAPILLVRQQSMDLVKEYIKNNLVSGGTVYILGGTKAVPASMESGLDGFNVVRLGGADRYETNLLILKEAGVTRGEDILICTGKNFADTLSASAVNKPILLVKDNLFNKQKDYLKSVSGGQVYIVGGKSAVSEQLATELATYGSAKRIYGATRYETSINVAKTFFGQTTCAVLAYGNNFPDGLCGGALANSMGAPLILVTNDKYSAAEQYATDNNLGSGVVLGGTRLINNTVTEKIFDNE